MTPRLYLPFALALCISVMLVLEGCGSDNTVAPQEPTATTVVIGTQEWMTKNLDVSRFRNGDSIFEVRTIQQWISAGREGKPAWCYYNNDPSNGSRYGKLYNWFAVADARGLAPEGFHVASDSEWSVLVAAAGGDANAGARLKTTSGWSTGNGENVVGFWALPAGSRDDGDFAYLGSFSSWWTSTEHDAMRARMRLVSGEDRSASEYDLPKSNGMAVRCIKD